MTAKHIQSLNPEAFPFFLIGSRNFKDYFIPYHSQEKAEDDLETLESIVGHGIYYVLCFASDLHFEEWRDGR